MEQSLVLLKPDTVQRGLIGTLIGRLEARGFTLRGALLVPSSFPFAVLNTFPRSPPSSPPGGAPLLLPSFRRRQLLSTCILSGLALCSDTASDTALHPGMKLMNVDRQLAEEHYAELSDKPFYTSLCSYICSAPVVAMVWEGKNAVKLIRSMIGATKPTEAAPGTVRGDFCIDVGRNIIHASDSLETAKREMKLWFPEGLCTTSPWGLEWVYEDVPDEIGTSQPSIASRGSGKADANGGAPGGKSGAGMQKQELMKAAIDSLSADAKKKATKEGGKKGADLAGMSAMGGQEFFAAAVDEPQGDMAMLEAECDAMECDPDPNEAEIKGGAGQVGKLLISNGTYEVALLASVPQSLEGAGKVNAVEWLQWVANATGGDASKCLLDRSDRAYARAVVKADLKSGLYAIRMKDDATPAAFSYLKSVGAIPEDDDDDDDDDDDINYADAAGACMRDLRIVTDAGNKLRSVNGAFDHFVQALSGELVSVASPWKRAMCYMLGCTNSEIYCKSCVTMQ